MSIKRARDRRNWVLDRMVTENWLDPRHAARERSAPLEIRRGKLDRPAARHFTSWVAEQVQAQAAGRIERGRGVVVETGLDPLLQQLITEEWGSQRIINLYDSIIYQLKDILRKLGLTSIQQLRGRKDLLKYIGSNGNGRSA